LVAASAAKSELGVLFLNSKEAKIMCLTLEELGHPQSATPVHIDNSTTVGIVNNTIKRQKSRSMERITFGALMGPYKNYLIFSIFQDSKILQITPARATKEPIIWQCAQSMHTCPLPLVFSMHS
jgi:hypothetical protein